MKIKLSKSQWELVGKKAGWIKTAFYAPKIGEYVMFYVHNEYKGAE